MGDERAAEPRRAPRGSAVEQRKVPARLRTASWSGVLDRLISVSDANTRGLSKLVADAESGHEWVIVRGSRPAACIVGLDAFRALDDLGGIERDEVTFLLGYLRLAFEGPTALSVAGLWNDGAASLGMLIVRSAAAELADLDDDGRREVVKALRHVQADPEAGSRCGTPAPGTFQIRLYERAGHWITYIWDPAWALNDRTPCVLEICRATARGEFDRLRKAVEILTAPGAASPPLPLPALSYGPWPAPGAVERRQELVTPVLPGY